MQEQENVELSLFNNVFYDYDINSLKIFYTILRFISMDKEVKEFGAIEHPQGYYTCDIDIKDLAKAINYKSRHRVRLEGLGQRVKEVFEKGVGTKSKTPDALGNFPYKKQHPIYEHSYENGVFSVKIPVTVFEATKTFFVIEKIEELMKLDDKISFRLYQILYSNISRGEYTIHLKHFNTLMGTEYETRVLASKLRESFEEINEKTDICIDIDGVKKLTKEINGKSAVTSLLVPYARKNKEIEEPTIANSKLEKYLEKAMLNRFFADKYKKNPAQNLSVIYKLTKEFSEEIVINALSSITRDLKVEIKNSLQAYVTKACQNEAENVRLAQEKEAEKLAKAQVIEEKKQEIEKEKETAKNNDAEIMETYNKMTAEERAEIVKKAEEFYLTQCEASAFNSILRNIFDKNKRAYIIQVMKGA